ncbi:MAG: ABC-F family ATP-binding cassette domain-containing protein [Rhodothermales bacterium]|nr:ABC-F family ATP-binding cassette domain-containing protein [Rhodothermales bacterium]MBO6779153.1 ABC-F family ATP-binding cassette domain-containing protein [Rhodothermales bacterium]
MGPNGAGKTTLLKVLTGQQDIDGGSIQLGGSTLGYLRQEVEESPDNQTVIEEALTAFENVEQLEAREKEILRALETETDHTTERYARLLHDLDDVHTALHAADAHTARPRAETVLLGLGFEVDDLERPLTTFSGGWRMRVALARLLLKAPDVLLLDEPTNHLDIDSIAWLEGYLKAYAGTIVIVSHDRYVLDRLVTTTAELAHGRVNEFAGNYSFYLTERVAQREIQRAAFVNQQKMIAETERFIERFRYKNTKATQVQSRVKQLEKLERIPEPEGDAASISFRFPSPTRSARSVVSLSTFTKVYETDEGSVEVFRDADPLTVERGHKIALIGRNGAGKSTLARMMGGTEPFEGERRVGRDVDINFFAQHTADTLDPADTVLEAVQRAARGQTETELRSILGAFLFRGEDVFKPVRVLSGGERSRVALAKTLVQPANFLILDEPTNHLDIRSIEVLIEAMQQYSGTFAVVSHDRHFLDQVATVVWRVEDGGVHVYPGTYSEYRWRMEQQKDRPPEPPPKPKARKPKKKKPEPEPVVEAPKPGASPEAVSKYERMNTFNLRRLHEKTEASIMEAEERKSDLETRLGDPSLYADESASQEATRAYDAVREDLEALYEKWESLSEVLGSRKR